MQSENSTREPPTCPAPCGGALVTYEGRTSFPTGTRLRCTACGAYTAGRDVDVAAALEADEEMFNQMRAELGSRAMRPARRPLVISNVPGTVYGAPSVNLRSLGGVADVPRRGRRGR